VKHNPDSLCLQDTQINTSAPIWNRTTS